VDILVFRLPGTEKCRVFYWRYQRLHATLRIAFGEKIPSVRSGFSFVKWHQYFNGRQNDYK
jgi:hypothetical protein